MAGNSGNWSISSLLQAALNRLGSTTHAHSTAPVPAEHFVPGYRAALIFVGLAFTLTALYIGSELGQSLGLAAGIRATVIGSLAICVMSIPAAIVGCRTRLSTYMIISNVFGNGGARLVNLVLALVLLGWYAVTAELFGRTCYLAMADYFSSVAPQWVFTTGCSGLVIMTTVFGIRAIERLSLLVAPLLVILTCYIAWQALARVSWQVLIADPGAGGDLSTGISAVIGGTIVLVVLMPDITRYSRSSVDCALISITGNGLGTGTALVLAMLPALAFHEVDPMKYMAALGLVGVSLATLVLSTWTSNAINLYSTGLVTSTAFRKAGYGFIVLGCGFVGTTAAVIGIADKLLGFLVILGLVVPPIASIYLTDFFVLGRRDYGADRHLRERDTTNLNGILACCAGGLVGMLMYYSQLSLTGVPTIESFISAGLLYAGAERLRQWTGRDRCWRAEPTAAQVINPFEGKA
jgi:cytosine permease